MLCNKIRVEKSRKKNRCFWPTRLWYFNWRKVKSFSYRNECKSLFELWYLLIFLNIFFKETTAQEEIIPYVVKNSLDIVLKLNENPDKNDFYLKNNKIDFKTFTVLINEALKYSIVW